VLHRAADREAVPGARSANPQAEPGEKLIELFVVIRRLTREPHPVSIRHRIASALQPTGPPLAAARTDEPLSHTPCVSAAAKIDE